MKRFAVLLVVLFVVGKIAIKSDEQDRNPSSNAESENSFQDDTQIKESCAQIHKLFSDESNLTSAQKETEWEKYQDKFFKWKLKVLEVSNISGDYAVDYLCSPSDPYNHTITVYYPESAKDEILKFKKGKVHEVSGQLRGYQGLTGYFLIAKSSDL